MRTIHERVIPLIVTVGQVVIFPYYIIWLKTASYDYTIFAWLFAAFSFSSAWGYKVFQNQRKNYQFVISFVYLAMSMMYLCVGFIQVNANSLLYVALFLQVFLGFLQGYYRAHHSKQKSYHLNIPTHYVLVGCVMVLLSFLKVISPSVFVCMYGFILLICAGVEWYSSLLMKMKKEAD